MRRTDGADLAVVREDLADVPLRAWWQGGVALPGALGRGGVRVIEVGGHAVVIRRHRRGGALRHLLPDRFRSPDRAVEELAVTAELASRGVLVAEPLAALAHRAGLGFELAFATILVRDSSPLPDFVARYPALRHAALRGAGALVARAFAAGLRHPDLHPGNLLARASATGTVDIVLIDLDRARLVATVSEAQRDAMLVRMARWLWRHASKLDVTVRARDFAEFLRGMGLVRAERRLAWDRMARKLRWSLVWRGIGMARR